MPLHCCLSYHKAHFKNHSRASRQFLSLCFGQSAELSFTANFTCWADSTERRDSLLSPPNCKTPDSLSSYCEAVIFCSPASLHHCCTLGQFHKTIKSFEFEENFNAHLVQLPTESRKINSIMLLRALSNLTSNVPREKASLGNLWQCFTTFSI